MSNHRQRLDLLAEAIDPRCPHCGRRPSDPPLPQQPATAGIPSEVLDLLSPEELWQLRTIRKKVMRAMESREAERTAMP